MEDSDDVEFACGMTQSMVGLVEVLYVSHVCLVDHMLLLRLMHLLI